VVLATAKFNVEVPEPVMDVGVKVTVTPVGWPVAERATAEANPLTPV
jgi:hypothetical protein